MLEPDEVNLQNKEERRYNQWERELKSKILSLRNTEKKQELWRKYFPQVQDNNLTEVY